MTGRREWGSGASRSHDRHAPIWAMALALFCAEGVSTSNATEEATRFALVCRRAAPQNRESLDREPWVRSHSEVRDGQDID
jgi:hypothetical protein